MKQSLHLGPSVFRLFKALIKALAYYKAPENDPGSRSWSHVNDSANWAVTLIAKEQVPEAAVHPIKTLFHLALVSGWIGNPDTRKAMASR